MQAFSHPRHHTFTIALPSYSRLSTFRPRLSTFCCGKLRKCKKSPLKNHDKTLKNSFTASKPLPHETPPYRQALRPTHARPFSAPQLRLDLFLTVVQGSCYDFFMFHVKLIPKNMRDGPDDRHFRLVYNYAYRLCREYKV